MNYPFYQYNQQYQTPQFQAPQFQAPQFQAPQFQAPQFQTQNQNPDERIWVQGEAGANAYLVAPNSFVRLWDSQAQVFYEKRADASGRPTTEVYEYSLRSAQTPQIGSVQPKADNSISEQLKALETRIQALEDKEVKTNVPKKSKSNADDTEV